MVVRANRVEHNIGGQHFHVCVRGDALRGGVQSFFPRAERGIRRRHGLFPGTRVAGNLRARVSGRPHQRAEAGEFPARTEARRRLSSYPHPWLMPDFWEFPTVSMGLSPLMAIYQARFNRYLEDRGMKPVTDAKVWGILLGDGETDEPESLGAITLASREKLDNLIFVVNCNLQRLDGPVRGNGQIIQELESAFRGAGWNVIKVLWGSELGSVLERDTEGLLVKRHGRAGGRRVPEAGGFLRGVCARAFLLGAIRAAAARRANVG